jgi:hypothetical protein
VLLPAPGASTRGPVNTVPSQPAEPVKLEVSEKTPTPAVESDARGKGETREDAAQRGGRSGRGGGGGGAGRGGPAGEGWRGGSYPGGGSRPAWVGGGWPAPVYVARPYYFDPFWASGAFGWSPMFYAPWSLMWGTAGYWPGPWLGSTTFNTGGVRLKVKPRDAQVMVDGFYAGVVDEFDGVFQSLQLAPGGHKIEVRMPGFDTITFDVHVQPDRTVTLSEAMKATP